MTPALILCVKVEAGMRELLEDGRETVKASEIAERGNIEEKDGHGPGWRVGWALGNGACDGFETVGYEILSNEDTANDYRLWRK